MAKTELTKIIEQIIINRHRREYGCPEVSIGFGTAKDGRVDYMVMNSKGVFRCYEIKVTKADFRSSCINSFEGHYNYYVMPEWLFNEVAGEIPEHIGIFVLTSNQRDIVSKKPAKKQNLPSERVLQLTQYLARSLARDANRYYETQNEHIVPKLKCRIKELEKDNNYMVETRNKYLSELVSIENDLSLIYGDDFREIVREKAAEIKENRRRNPLQ